MIAGASTLSFKLFGIYLILLSIVAGPAAAKGLDGTWCSPNGQHITVDGLDVITPGGQQTTGAYSKENFHFKLPENEWNAGSVIWMELKSESTVRVSTVSKIQNGPPPHGLWKKCDITSHRSPTTEFWA